MESQIDNKKSNSKIIINISIILFLIVGVSFYFVQNKINKQNKFIEIKNYVQEANEKSTSKIINVLIVEIDPVLRGGVINGVNCENKKASDCLGQDSQSAVDELVEDLEYASHDNIKVNIVKTDHLNEFPTNETTTTLINGDISYKLDEETWLYIMKNGWYGFWDNEIVKQFEPYSFNYQYLIDKLDLVNRKNNNEFDEIWLLNVDPINTYETMMVGKTAYWINGEPLIADCDNFKIVNVSISRKDANLECFGHAAENILSKVFKSTLNTYSKNSETIDNTNYNNLSLWEKFILNDYFNTKKNTGLSGVGNVHFSPNSESDYDWANYSNKVYSKWQEWENYPNLTLLESTSIFDPKSAYLDIYVPGTYSEARQHHRWWFSLMPHLTERTDDGYLNDWWIYLTTYNYVTEVIPFSSNYTYKVGDIVDEIKMNLLYYDQTNEIININKYSNNITFSDESLVRLDENNKIVAVNEGETVLKYFIDGIFAEVAIKITKN